MYRYPFFLIDKNQYDKLVKKVSKPSPKFKDFVFAFVIGGIICVIGQLLKEFFISINLSEDHVTMLVPVVLIFISALLTGIGWFDKIAKRAGAGTLVPITGFANAVSSAAVEFKAEGIILGTCVKMFTIAGPVLVFGITASVLYGLFLFFVG